MTHEHHPLVHRLHALAAALARREDALALLALGSVGVERERIDAWSDLDFFVVVREGGAKSRFIDDLSWLAEAHPLVWHFRNTADGHKALMADGVYAEFAVFEPRELPHIAYAPGRLVWQREGAGLDAGLAAPRRPLPAPHDAAWLVGEALSNLLVGLMRYARGEHLAAMRLVPVHALDRVLELRERSAALDAAVRCDPFNVDRRVQQRQPGVAALLELAELRRLAPVPAAIGARIDALPAHVAAP
jgi:hypothetical protein